ncbi:uncharacterized protein LOC129737887 [Uranotaenia lowii]|uniref:uncharacterized protein LOC129737887 n=1 Tax=Uranotaenia lowii TaxID=190385 RepID=UPI00247A528E|nr:uncharacterized protein LOC129737887 [Uranotaenia lowii]
MSSVNKLKPGKGALAKKKRINQNCQACDLNDTYDNMVQCDRCQTWWHLVCAGVNESIEDRDWICPKCREVANSCRSGSRSSSALQRLKDRQDLERQRVDIELSKQFLEEQNALINAEEFQSFRTQGSMAAAEKRTQQWVDSIHSDDGAVGGAPRATTTPIKESLRFPSNRELEEHNLQMAHRQGKAVMGNQLAEFQRQLKQCQEMLAILSPEEPNAESTRMIPSSKHNGRCTGAIPKTVTIAREAINRPSESAPKESLTGNHKQADIHLTVQTGSAPSAHLNQLLDPVTSEFVNPVSLSPQQLAARQSFARDLPVFTGDPAEWPMFIANYEYTTAVCGFTNGENMLRLQRCLKGYALEKVRNRIVLPAAVPQVIEALRQRFGRPNILINSLLQMVRTIPVQRSDKLEGLVEYGEAVQELCDHIEAANEQTHLANPQLLQELIAKLPTDYQMQWAAYSRELTYVDLRCFGDFMNIVAQDASRVISFNPKTKNALRDRSKSKGFINLHNETGGESDQSDLHEQQRQKARECVFCGKTGHRMRECFKFKGLSVDERWNKARALKVCFSCLCSHGRRSCRSASICNIDGCEHRHHPLLHGTKPDQNATLQVAEHHTHRTNEAATIFRLLPVTVYGPKCAVETYAFVDEGSSLTLVENDLVNELGLRGSLQPLCLQWTGNTSRMEKESQIVNIEVSGVKQKKRSTLTNARTVACLNLPIQNFDAEHAIEHSDHLRGIPINSYRNAKPRLLIGIDNLRLAVPLKVKEGEGSSIVAVKTRLGWCVYGKSSPETTVTSSYHVRESSADYKLHELVKFYFNIDNIDSTVTKPLSKQEDRALSILSRTTKHTGHRFETGLLWADDEIILPDSFNMAHRRLECLERKMNRSPKLKENLHKQIAEYVSKKYAHKATPEELSLADPNRIWYLPLGAVMNPKKPEKIRIIWNAAAEVSGVSLNKNLLKGPDLLTSLSSILFQFRLYRFAVSSDIQEMFHQIQIRPEDRNSQRFLWRSDPSLKAEIYLMDVATFGSTCSPASAQFIKNLNAEQHAPKFPEAAISIINRYHVDDYFESFDEENDAKRIAADIVTIQKNAGFTLHN